MCAVIVGCYCVTTLSQECLLDFLKLMGDSDRHVRKAAVVALSAVVHHKPGLVTAGLPQLLPLLFDQTVIKPEMVRCFFNSVLCWSQSCCCWPLLPTGDASHACPCRFNTAEA